MKYKTGRGFKRTAFFFLWLTAIIAAAVLFTNCGKKKVTGKKQIILISIDTLRGDHISPYGYKRDTSPHLSALVNDADYYANAYTNGCWTMPSHISLLTGTLPSRHGVNKDWFAFMKKKYPKLKDSIKSLAEILKEQNMNTVKFAFLPDELGFGRGFAENRIVDPFANDQIFGLLLKKLEKNKAQDFFFFIHTWQVHAPYSNAHYLEEGRIDKEKRHYLNNFREMCPEKNKLTTAFIEFLKGLGLYNVPDCITLYDSGIRHVDRYVGRIIDKTKELGIYDDLMFVVVSDHGEHFGEHFKGNFYDCHGIDFYEEFIKIPIIFKYPHRYKQGISRQPVSLVDVIPTILDFYEIKAPAYVQGESLLKPFPKRKKKYIISESVSVDNVERKMIRVGDLKYTVTMKNPGKPERVNWDSIIRRDLFDLKTDPLEKNNLYSDLKFRKISIELEKMLHRLIKESAKMNLSIEEADVTRETLKHLEALGYLD